MFVEVRLSAESVLLLELGPQDELGHAAKHLVNVDIVFRRSFEKLDVHLQSNKSAVLPFFYA